jgi:hypothetical protein
MQISADYPSSISNGKSSLLSYGTDGFSNGKDIGRHGRNAASNIPASVSSRHFSSDTLKLTFENGDGDSVVLDLQHIEYSKTMSGNQESEAAGQWGDMADFVKDEFDRLKKEIIEKFVAWMNGEQETEETEETGNSNEIPGLPEYWNAENTSQRIVDFAISFSGMFEGEGSEFVETMKSAIDEGFKQARDILGNLPGQVGDLVNDTYELVMKKLDNWAAAQGIGKVEEAAA